MDIDIKYLNKNAKTPEFKTDGSGAMDLYLPFGQVVNSLPTLVHTGLAIHIKDPNVVGLVTIRSSMATKRSIVLSHSVGVIDSDYTGELLLLLELVNGDPAALVHEGDRIAQIMFVPIIRPTFNVVDELNITTRGDGGFGSTGY